jgi:hypothetical protein
LIYSVPEKISYPGKLEQRRWWANDLMKIRFIQKHDEKNADAYVGKEERS